VKRHGRKKPYTKIGVTRLPCARCGNPAKHQWQVCADNNMYRPICASCDIKLNKMVLLWMKDPNALKKVREYKEY